jgi:hypothetical protein
LLGEAFGLAPFDLDEERFVGVVIDLTIAALCPATQEESLR